MNNEERARRQNLRVIISEIIMVTAVIVTVTLLAFLVSGYGINSDFKVERQGMLQIYSMPTGASVEVDGEAPWYQRTNTSKVLSAGQHDIKLVRDGYDSWSKNVTISEGLLYRIHYPRLFLLDRTVEDIINAEKYDFTTVSPDRKKLLLANHTTEWTLVNLESENPTPKTLDISNLFTPGNIISAEWDNNNDRVLLRTSSTTAEWILLNVDNPSESVNITSTFTMKFDHVRIFDRSANNLLAVQSGNLYKIDVSGKKMSDILLSNVVSFEFYNNEIVFTAKMSDVSDYTYSLETSVAEDIDAEYFAGILRLDNNTVTALRPVVSSAKIYLSRFYDERYITIVNEQNISIYRRNDFAQIFTSSISFVPHRVKVGISGDFIFMINGQNVATVDMEVPELREWQLDTTSYGWLDDNMVYGVTDGGGLVVYDFDGLNRRELSSGVDAGSFATVSADKWLYYLSNGNLTREKIAN